MSSSSEMQLNLVTSHTAYACMNRFGSLKSGLLFKRSTNYHCCMILIRIHHAPVIFFWDLIYKYTLNQWWPTGLRATWVVQSQHTSLIWHCPGPTRWIGSQATCWTCCLSPMCARLGTLPSHQPIWHTRQCYLARGLGIRWQGSNVSVNSHCSLSAKFPDFGELCRPDLVIRLEFEHHCIQLLLRLPSWHSSKTVSLLSLTTAAWQVLRINWLIHMLLWSVCFMIVF